MWRATDPQGNEAGKIKYDIVAYTRGAVLDLGCGPSKAFPHFVGVDNLKDVELFGIDMKPDVEDDCATLSKFEDGQCDAVFSSHLLEHIADAGTALANWWRVLKIGGHLVLYLPHRDLYPNIGQPDANPDHKHDFTPMDIDTLMMDVVLESGTGYDCVRSELRDEDCEYSFLMVFKKIEHGTIYSCMDPLPQKTACVVRYGGFGDMLQAANLLPELKRQGYHVTFMTTPKGQDILREDPHVDAWFIQDDDQVPNHELAAFWSVQAKRFDKFIQLSESVEGTLLAMPGRANHAWPQEVRHAEMNKNYLEWTSQLAGLPYASESRFYPTMHEAAKVAGYLGGIRVALAPLDLMIGAPTPPVFVILWVLAGSSIHKFYPWQDSVIARILLDMPEAVVIFSGDTACQILEAGWENEPRVVCESGNMDIRSTLTLATMADMVVGPETGVLNAVAFEPRVRKVVLLSHSSKENLSKHWVRTDTMEPADTPCYPCHRLHYGSTFCHQHEQTGAAMCQLDIAPERVYNAIVSAYEKWKTA